MPMTGVEPSPARKPGKPIRAASPASPTSAENGAGHYVKMVHNGIEYGDMQMICEAYA
jgi:6-phosphogluconate dehydrogenase